VITPSPQTITAPPQSRAGSGEPAAKIMRFTDEFLGVRLVPIPYFN
jgi:hypothetical protein